MITTTSKTSHEQVIRKADERRQRLGRECQEQTARIAAISAQVSTLEAQARERQTQLSTLRETAGHFAGLHESLKTQEELAQGTVGEGNLTGQVKAAERERGKAERALRDFEARVTTEAARDRGKLDQLLAEREACNQKLADLSLEIAATEGAKHQAHQDMGEAEYQEIAAQFDELRTHLARKENEANVTQAALEALADEALRRLQAWPDLQERVKPLFLPYQDETVHVLEAAITLYDLLLTEGPQATIPPYVFHQVQQYGDFMDLLALSERDVWAISTGRLAEAITIRERKAQFERLLDLYRQAH